MVIDAEIEHDVGKLCVATVSFDDQERCRLLSAPVAACTLRCGQTVDQPDGETLAGRRLERVGERVDCLGSDQDVPLGGVAASCASAGPVDALGARVGHPFAL